MKDFLLKGMIFLGALLVIIVIAEGVVRIVSPQCLENPIDFYIGDDFLGWKLQPNLNKQFSGSDFVMQIRVNSQGFRGREASREENERVLNIAGIGDSFLFGYGMNDQEGVLSILENEISQMRPEGFMVETINFGVPRYNINQYERILHKYVTACEPDLVLVFFYNNDWRRDQGFDYKGVTEEGFLWGGEQFSWKSLRSFLLPIRVFLKRHSHLYMLVRSRSIELLRRLKLMYLPEIALYKQRESFDEEFAHTFTLIREMNRYCRDTLRCPMVLCMIPEKFQVMPELLTTVIDAYGLDPRQYDWFQPQKHMKKFCLMNGILYLDFYEVMANASQERPLYFKTDPHWNKYGHEVAAEALITFLQTHQMIPGVQE